MIVDEPLVLFRGPVPNPQSVVYIATLVVVVRQLQISNVTAGAVAATVVVGGTVLVPAESVPANRRLVVDLAERLEVGETIAALTSVPGALSMRATGFSLV